MLRLWRSVAPTDTFSAESCGRRSAVPWSPLREAPKFRRALRWAIHQCRWEPWKCKLPIPAAQLPWLEVKHSLKVRSMQDVPRNMYFFLKKKKVTATLGIFHWLKTNKKKLIFFSCALLLPLQHSSVFPQNILTHEKFVIETQQNIHPPMPITTLMCIITTCGFRDRTSVNNACYWVI